MVVDDGCDSIGYPTIDTRTVAPFFENDAALFLNIFGQNFDAVAPVAQHEQHLLIEFFVGCGHIVHGITRVVNARKGFELVEMIAAQKVHNAVGEVVSGVESQMLEHVSQSYFGIVL